MKKGQLTKELIIEKSASVFNCRGYFGTSMSDLMATTGLEKGGIYNHFKSKEELALAAFDYVVNVNSQRMLALVESRPGALQKLLAVIEWFEQLPCEQSIPGGCPLLNLAVESDDTNPILRERARHAMKRLLRYIEMIASDGIKSGELREDTDAVSLALFLIAGLEGGVMLAKLYDQPAHMTSVTAKLKQHIHSCAR